MHEVEEIPRGSNPNHYFSSLSAAATRPSLASSQQQKTSTKQRKRVNYNIQAIQAQQLRAKDDDSNTNADGGENLIEEEQSLLNQIALKKANKRFEELSRENYNDQSKFEIPKSFSTSGRVDKVKVNNKVSVTVRRLLNSKKNWSNYLDELDKKELRMYNRLEVKADKLMIKKVCTICGNISYSTCINCGSRVCCVKCLKTHNETRCSKF